MAFKKFLMTLRYRPCRHDEFAIEPSCNDCKSPLLPDNKSCHMLVLSNHYLQTALFIKIYIKYN